MATAQISTPAELDELATLVMRGDADRAAFDAALLAAERAAAALPGAADRLVNEARTAFLVGFAEIGYENPGAADAAYQWTVARALEANRLAPTSEGFRILADAQNQLLDLRGVAYKMLNVGAARRATERAVELDPTNALAHLAAAAFNLSAPAIVGGDSARGEHHLEEAEARAGDSEYAAFVIAIWRARVEAGRGDRGAAIRWLDRAAAVYPANWLVSRTARELGLPHPGTGR